MSSNLGGKRRNIFTPCGRHYVGELRTVNKLFTAHQKYCAECASVKPPTPSYHSSHMANGFNGMTYSRNGNPMRSTNTVMCALTPSGKDATLEVNLPEGTSPMKSVKEVKEAFEKKD